MEIDKAAKAFLQGDIDFGTFTVSIERSIASNPESAQHIRNTLDEIYRSGRLPAQVFHALQASIGQALENALIAGALEKALARADDAAILGIGTQGAAQAPGAAPGFAQEDEEGADKTRIVIPPRSSAPLGPVEQSTSEGRSTLPHEDDGKDDGSKTRWVPPRSGQHQAGTPGEVSSGATTGNQTGPATGRSVEGSHTGTGSVTGSAITGQTGRTDKSQSNWSTTTGSWAGGEDREVGPGDTIKGRFLLETIVGKGGMGVVFKARDLMKEEAGDRNSIVAIKVLNEEFKQHPQSLRALQREARKSQTLSHPNIVTVHDFDRDGGIVYMQMEFLDGTPLDILIKSTQRERFSVPELIDIVLGMGEALAYAHTHDIIHSDFKPGNVYLTSKHKVKVFDFGIARASNAGISGEGEKTLFNAGDLGALTPAYASLEMIKGEEPDKSDDVYALALVAYELFTGKHPFGKLAADKALDKNLLPAPVKGLSRRQQRALRKGLAFRRSERTESVEKFVDGIRIKKTSKVLVAASVAAVLLVAGGFTYFVPTYLEESRQDDLIARLMSDNQEVMNLALVDLSDETESNKIVILTKPVQDNIFVYFDKLRANRLDYEADRYQFPEVEKLIAQLTAILPDSARLAKEASRVEDDKAALLNDLTTDFNDIVERDELVVEGDSDNVRTLLGIVSQIDPNHVLLSDQRIIRTYTRVAKQHMEEQRLEDSLAVIDSGLMLFENEPSLLNARDQIQSVLNRIAKEERISVLTAELSALRDATNLADYRSGLAALSELIDLAPKHELAVELSSDLSTALVGELDKMLDEKDWVAADTLLNEFAPALDIAFVRDTQAKVASASSVHEKNQQALLATVEENAVGGFQTEANEQAARRALDELRQMVPSETVLSAAEDALLRSYIEAARGATADQQWGVAEEFVERGKSVIQSDIAQDRLNAQSESIQLARAASEGRLKQEQKEALEAERQSEIAELVSRYNDNLLIEPFTEKNLEQALNAVEELSSIARDHALVADAPSQLAERLAATVTVYADQGKWADANLILSRFGARLPSTTRLQAVKQRIATGIAAVEENEAIVGFDEQRKQFSALLEAAEFTADWDARLRTELRAIELSPQSNPDILEATKTAVADTYKQAIKSRIATQKFSEARGLLDQASNYVPAPLLTSIEEELSTAESTFEAENGERIRLAEIEGLKQTLVTQAQALDVNKAIDTLKKLETAVPDDSFITLKARPEIAESYAKLADRMIDREKYTEAGEYVDAGLKFDLNNRRLNDQLKIIDQKEQFAGFTKDFIEQRVSDGQLLDQWGQLNKRYPEQFTEYRDRLALQIKGEIDASNIDKREKAERLVSLGNQFYGDGTFILPAPSAEPEVTPPPIPEPPVAPEPKPEIAAKPKSGSGPGLPMPHSRTCKDGFAGHGLKGAGVCYDFVADQVKAPLMVVVPAGGGLSGVYAIGKYEISWSDYNLYCQRSGICTPQPGNEKLPVTDVSLEDIKAYTRWLSESTGYEYRIPTSDQWLHAARGSKEVSLEGVNCSVKIGGKLIKGLALADVSSGSGNSWGVVNAIGNAQEVVLDGAAPKLRGGAYLTPMSDCGLESVASYDGSGNSDTGFRLVRIIEGD